jgi:hypothetical protein
MAHGLGFGWIFPQRGDEKFAPKHDLVWKVQV